MSRAPLKRVAVVGAGISGVVTAGHLKKLNIDVTVYERSAVAGGLWVFDERKPLEPAYPAISASRAESIYDSNEANLAGDIALLQAPPGPCYFGLKNNVSTRLLETTLSRFPVNTPDFVTHAVLGKYIQDTAAEIGVNALTRYNTEVKRISKMDRKWVVETARVDSVDFVPVETCVDRCQTFDAVVVASGHYHAPRVPDISGLVQWKRQWAHRIQHSKSYRRPEDYGRGKNFLLIGGSVSSADIARELGPLAKHIYQSQRNGAFDLPASILPDNATRVDEVVSFDEQPTLASASSAGLEDPDPIPATITLKSGRKLCDIHHVIICTGYHITLPFLPDLHSDTTHPLQADSTVLVTDGTQYHNLHKDIFYIPDPTLVFVGVPYFTATFTLFEFQAMVVALVVSGKARLPSEGAMRDEYTRRVEEKGFGKGFHSLRNKEVEYVDELLEWINADLREGGLAPVSGHSSAWHEAKEEQLSRIQALFASGDEPHASRGIEVVCL
ncbi:putative dimethylaniline monooxygenase [Polyplosphaeria fusca]|uniref:Dimethylaniline monooxygenase n=1 Tax=Polyplosphaeria fusca TaxID=682080 RepID=A0A9P4RBI1_9PLEO|nr:putative dimethylaniline monooxygenase [Polyplosphaeria fusca]